MAKKQINIRLSDYDIEQIDKMCNYLDVNRTELIRRMLVMSEVLTDVVEDDMTNYKHAFTWLKRLLTRGKIVEG